MLEQPILLLRPRKTSPRQAIVAADTGEPVGFARWPARVESLWWPLSGRPVLAVYEHEDEPLLFTVYRCWSLLPRHEVCDADGHHVGILAGRQVRDRFGRNLAALRRERNGSAALFLSPDGRSLGRVTTDADGVRVAFDPEVAGDPFTKMLLLAAALSTTATR
jgi:hypothetical protein